MPFIGTIEYHLLNDGLSWNDGGGAFGLVPKVIWEKKLPPDPYNRVPFHLNCLLLKTEGKIILVDTGLGYRLNEKQAMVFGLDRQGDGLIEKLAELNIAPADVDIVVNTHLHGDHCGGNTRFAEDRKTVIPTFPNAEYWIQRLEWADAAYPNERTRATYLPDNFLPLQKTGQLKLLNGDTSVVNGVQTVITRGHTRAHQSILIESEGNYGLYVADMATLAYHFERTAWVTAYDVEPLENIETKRHWQHWAVKTGATILFEHEPNRPVGVLHPKGRHFQLISE